MKILTLFGTRPEIIRLSVIIKYLDQFCKHVLVHTGQNYDENLSDIFFRELDLRRPGQKGLEYNQQTLEQVSAIIDDLLKNDFRGRVFDDAEARRRLLKMDMRVRLVARLAGGGEEEPELHDGRGIVRAARAIASDSSIASVRA